MHLLVLVTMGHLNVTKTGTWKVLLTMYLVSPLTGESQGFQSHSSLLFTYLVSTKHDQHMFHTVYVLEFLLLMEIHYIRIGSASPLMKGNSFHVNVTIFIILYSSTLSKSNAGGQVKKKKNFF